VNNNMSDSLDVFKNMSLVELRKECKSRGIDFKGLKCVLVHRLLASVGEVPPKLDGGVLEQKHKV